MGYTEIEEEVIREIMEEENDLIQKSNYQTALAVGDYYRNQGLTPYYMYDSFQKKLFVSSQEAVHRKMH